MIKLSRGLRKTLLSGVGAPAVAFALATMPASAVVPNDNQTPEEIIDDEVDVTGVGMFFRNDGFVCTGSLINPRTVLFAAHCVNDRPEADYGTSVRSAFSFQADALPGFIDWIGSGFQSNPDLYVYDINQIIYHPDSLLNPQAQGFIEADIAFASLDAPASDIPTWALLFSPLPTPESIDPVTGTGYHVDIVGYGRTGSGSVGDNIGVDFRRRAAENMLGSLSSLDDRNGFLFGSPPGFLPQNLYTLDFDDPNQTNFFDLNLHQDEALPGEGTTAGGDSGGPLVLDAANNAYNEDLILGVLSGGSRFFGGQSFSSYGTQSFYQPLFLYWDWIVANNPYRYVGTVEGDGNWEDEAHWVSLLDPAYRVLDENGAVVSGLPTSPGAGLAGDSPNFGTTCVEFHPRGGGTCQDLESGEIFITDPPVATGEGESIQSGIGRVSLADLGAAAEDGAMPAAVTLDGSAPESQDSAGRVDLSEFALTGAEDAPQADGFLDVDNPDPTFANGLPGGTTFVPNNVNPDILGSVDARYFDVTLSETGTTTLSSAVEIDRLALLNGAGLNVAEAGDLTSLIDITQMSGTMNVDGNLTSGGDYLIMSGLLSGSGTVTAPFVTSVAGVIAPGGMGTTGTLTIDGSLVLASGSVLMIDTTAAGSDLLTVTEDVSLGGVLAVNNQVAFGESFDVLQYGGEASGGFDEVLGLPQGVLRAELNDAEGGITLDITAASFSEVLPTDLTTSQASYAAALDAARGINFAGMQDVFSVVDYLTGDDLALAFDNMAPNDAIISGQGLLATGDLMSQRLDSRLRDVRRGQRGFKIAASSQAAEGALTDNPTGSSGIAQELDGGTETTTHEMSHGFGGFVNIDFYEADAETAFSGRDAELDGFALTGGIDKELGNGAVIGATVGYQSTEGNLANGTADTEISGGSVGFYGYVPLDEAVYIDGHVSFGRHTIDTARSVDLAGSVLAVSGDTEADTVLIGASVGRVFSFNNGVTFTPSLNALHADYEIDSYLETGSSAALRVDGRDLTSQQVSLSGLIEWEMGKTGGIRPSIKASVVRELGEDATDEIIGAFSATGATGPRIALEGSERSGTWVDLEVGLDIDLSDRLVGTIGARQTVNRDELDQTIIGGSLQFKF